MKSRSLAWTLVATIAIVAGACGSSSGGASTDLKGKQLVFASLGGSYQDAEVKAFIEPFMNDTGTTVISLEEFEVAKLKESVKAGAPIADVIDYDTTVSADLCKDYLIPIDMNIVDLSKVDQSMIASPCGAPIIRYGFGIFYSTTKFSTAPTGCKDFFDTAAFPGSRGVMGSAIPNQILECALIADGVAADKLYPLDLDRAFKKIESIKDSIKFWGSGAESADFMTAGEVDMLMAWTGRGYNAIEEQEAQYALVPNDIFVLSDDVFVPKGVNDPAAAFALVNSMMNPDRQVELARLIPYSPSRTDAKIDMSAPTAKYLVSNASFKTIAVNQKWWAENTQLVQDAWDKNITQ